MSAGGTANNGRDKVTAKTINKSNEIGHKFMSTRLNVVPAKVLHGPLTAAVNEKELTGSDEPGGPDPDRSGPPICDLETGKARPGFSRHVISRYLFWRLGPRRKGLPVRAAHSVPVSIGIWLSKALVRAEYSPIGAKCSIAFNRMTFKVWKWFHSDGTFADFYAWQITRKLDRGRAHRTLGKRRYEADNFFGRAPEHDGSSFFERNARTLLDRLTELGLKPDHKLVDFGCGSLRIGQHIIRYLERGHYWGLDVTDRFFRDGLSMLGDAIRDARAPVCRVITEQALNDVRSLQPDFVVSIAVLKHVPVEYLEQYFDNICSLATANTTLLISFSEGNVERQISGKSWAWSSDRIARLIKERLPNAEISIIVRRAQMPRNGVDLNYCLIAARPGNEPS